VIDFEYHDILSLFQRIGSHITQLQVNFLIYLLISLVNITANVSLLISKNINRSNRVWRFSV